MPRSESYLVAIGGIPRRRGGGYLSRGQLALYRLFNGKKRVGSARNAHRLIHITAPRKRIAYSSAQTGSRAAERLYLGGVVVSFVLEHQQPFLVLTVNVYRYLYGAGVYLLALVQIVKQTVLFQLLCRQRRYVHKAHGLVPAPKLLPVCAVLGIGIGDIGGLYVAVIYDSTKGGVATVVAPIGIYHADFRNGGVAFLASEIIAAEFYIVVIHSKSVFYHEISKLALCHVNKSAESFHAFGYVIFYLQRFILLKAALA